MRRSQVSIGAAYHHDPQKVIDLLEAIALTVPNLLHEPGPKARLVNYGESAIEYSLGYWMEDPLTNGAIKGDLNLAIWHAFQREGIEIPFPQQVAYLKEWPGEQLNTSNESRTSEPLNDQ